MKASDDPVGCRIALRDQTAGSWVPAVHPAVHCMRDHFLTIPIQLLKPLNNPHMRSHTHYTCDRARAKPVRLVKSFKYLWSPRLKLQHPYLRPVESAMSVPLHTAPLPAYLSAVEASGLMTSHTSPSVAHRLYAFLLDPVPNPVLSPFPL